MSFVNLSKNFYKKSLTSTPPQFVIITLNKKEDFIMKKIFIALLTLVMSICCFSFIACNEEKQADTYKFYSYQTSQETYNVGDPAPWGDQTITEDYIVLVLSKDGSLSTTTDVNGNVTTNTGVWSLDGENLTMTLISGDQSQTVYGTIIGDTLTYSVAGGQTFTFKKA